MSKASYFINLLNPIEDGLFRGCSQMGGWVGGGKKVPPFLNLLHISCNNETWHSYT